MDAAVGAVLLGPVGLLMGGMTGSKRQKERVNEWALKIMIDDCTAPVHKIVFFRMPGDGTDASSAIMRPPAQKMEHFQALLSNAIRSDQRASVALRQVPAGEDPEARIAKLWALHQDGAIDADEYKSQKGAILGALPSKALPPVDRRSSR